jgi:sigma-E factor negative regulatory protein RseB
MLGRSLGALALLGACALAPLASATEPPASETTLGRPEVKAWLMRIHEAASRRNFHGTFVVSAGGTISSARIAHYCDGTNQFERIETMDGRMRRVFRHNDVVHTLWPQSRVAVVEQRELMGSFPALLKEGDDRILESYEVSESGTERVAGHDSHVLQLKPRDALRFGYRLWAEKETGLLLRAEILGKGGEVLESSAFSEVDIGVKTQPALVVKPMSRLQGYRILRPTLSRTELESEGWTLRAPVPGFRRVSTVKRPLNVGDEPDAEAGPEVVQSIYSDGLTYVSLFIEPFDAGRHIRPMQTTTGATQALMRRQGDAWVTVVGDVPAATLRLFADALERRN